MFCWDTPAGLELRVRNESLIFLFLNQIICCGSSKNRLNEMVLLSTQNICLKLLAREYL